MKTKLQISVRVENRRGSTLVIVIALLGLLAFTGMIFFSFASQERAAAEYFSEAAKAEVDEPDNVWDHPLRHIISGEMRSPEEFDSILRSGRRRHTLVSSMVGADTTPFSGEGIHLIMEDDPSTADTTPVPRVDMNWDGSGSDEDGVPGGEVNNQTMLNFVDSRAANFGSEVRPEAMPAPDVDYTYPDINNLFLAYKGWAIRDNDPAGSGTISPRYERVPIIIPSFFRPQYMKSGGGNGLSGSDTPTDLNWASSFDGTDRLSANFPQRTFRPHPTHLEFVPDGSASVFRYLTNAEAAGAGIASGGFPFVPSDNLAGQPGGLNGIVGELGVWTGSEPDAYELDADNDGDGIREGIWLDTHFPVQEFVDGTGTVKHYVVLHSFTIYDLDGLMNVNVHGNLAGLDRDGSIPGIVGSGLFAAQSLSRSNLGLGPNEINPIWALRTNLLVAPTVDVAAQFMHHFGQLPTNPLEQANMEWVWILGGRAQIDASNNLEDLYAGRWGENDRLFNAFGPGGTFLVSDLPRPGRPGNAQQTLSGGTRYGGYFTTDGRNGFDDNFDARDGEVTDGTQAQIRPFGTPMDYAGTGRTHNGWVGAYNPVTGTFDLSGGGDIRTPILHHDTASTGPERFQRFNGYSVGRDVNTAATKYIFGQNGTFDSATGPSDDLVVNPFLDATFEDPLESIFDPEYAQRDFDRTFGPQDVFALHLTAADLASSPDEISQRLRELSPYALDDANAPFSFNEQVTPGVRGRFTTVSNSLRRFMMKSPFGIDGKPGIAGVDDDGDGTVDNLTDLTSGATGFVPGVIANGTGDNDRISRAWEFSADTDGNNTDANGLPTGDGNLEFPPAFGFAINMGQPYSSTDPFRPQARRLLTIESGDSRQLVGQLPLSINHLLDVERSDETPQEGTADFLRYMLRAGMRFRTLTDHPSSDPVLDVQSATVLTTTTLPTWTSAAPVQYPPDTPAEREFWARRDRQKLARDIYVLLYTTGGAGINTNGTLLDLTDDQSWDYTQQNLPGDPLGSSTCLYSHEQLRRMAQFAVNMVDAMDTDNIVTKFEYDKNFGPDGTGTFGGWNMDDDPYAANAMDATMGWNEDGPSASIAVTANGLYPEDGVERGVVYGVEAQELAFSEVLAATSPDFTPGMYADSPQTVHDDTSGDINILHIELQNLRPTAVDMATTSTGTTLEERAIWQLARYDRTGGPGAVQATVPTQKLSLMEGNPSVSGGGKFTIALAGKPGDPGNTDPTGWMTADLYVNYDSDPGATFELVSPDVTMAAVTSGSAVTPQCDLDLIAATHSGRWLASGNSTSAGLFLDGSPIPFYGGNNAFNFTGDGAREGFDLALRRRANPNMPQLPLAQNPWVEIDRFRVVFYDVFEPTTDPMTMITTMELHLENAPSQERFEVFNAITKAPYPADHNGDPNPEAYRFNTIKSSVNRATAMTGSQFEVIQQHFDRDFASSTELLQLPLVGPNLLTFRTNRMRYSPYQQVFPIPGSALPAGTPESRLLSSAEAMFLQPDFPNLSTADAGTLSPGTPVISVNTALDNRWYRLLQFVEVPSRVHRMLGDYIYHQKIPGKLNINMIRHREVLGGLIDNPYLADVPILADYTPGSPGTLPGNGLEDGPFMTAAATMGAGGRDVWHEMINDRDGLPVPGWNPVTGVSANFWVPGTPNAHPFRSYNFLRGSSGSEDGFDETVLRRLRNDLDDDSDGVPNDGTVGFNVNGTARVMVGGSADSVGTNRHWLEMASSALHDNPDGQSLGQRPNATTRHRILSKLVNNTTTVSNTFIVYGTAAYFEAYQDPGTGLARVGGRLDLDGDGDPLNDQQRAVFIIDRTDAFEAYDPGSGNFDWKRLVKAKATIQ